MSLSEPLAWPFHSEQLQSLAARIREWNGSPFPVEPAGWTWSTAVGGLARLGPEPDPGKVSVDVTPDDSAEPSGEEPPAPSAVSIDPAGAPVDVSTEIPAAGFSVVTDNAYGDAENRSVSLGTIGEAWTGASDTGMMQEPPPAQPPASADAKQFVPAFERDEEDDSELDIKPSERAKLSADTPPATSGNPDDDDNGWNV